MFDKAFWINAWEADRDSDTYAVHKGFSTPEYWDKAAATYNRDKTEVQNRRLGKTLEAFQEKGFLFPGMKVLDIGCGTGYLAAALAGRGALVTALDFSQAMLDRVAGELTPDLVPQVTLLKEDWHTVDIVQKGWEKKFDLVVAFMSPGVATPDAFLKMIRCSKNGCAIRGWAARKQSAILIDLWEKIMARPLEDNPQSILYKLNLLFSLGLFPDIFFDTIEWDQTMSLDREFDNQMAFFSKVSQKPLPVLEKIIQDYLNSLAMGDTIPKKHKGLTATAVFSVNPLI